ncbi:MAG: M48 family metalloprotease [Spirochaetota bacterium]
MNIENLYQQNQCSLDLHLTVYDGDFQIVKDLFQDEDFSKLVDRVLDPSPVYHSRRDLLKKGLRLTPIIAPEIYSLAEKARDILGLKPKIELYIYQDTYFNASCYPPDDRSLYIMITSALLEKFDPNELMFVIGHEIGHYLFNHHAIPLNLLLNKENSVDLSPLQVMKLYAWSRNAEISADRIGLLCAQDFEAAGKAFFKLSSGVTGDVISFQLSEYMKQLTELQSEVENSTINPDDWYSTHPFSPLRINALDVFQRSSTYYQLIGSEGGDIAEGDLENEVKQIMAIMEPDYLFAETPIARIVRKFLFLTAASIINADGEITDSELQAMQDLFGEVKLKNITRITEIKVSRIIQQLEEYAKEINLHLSVTKRLAIIRDLAVITYSDKKIDDIEISVMNTACDLLKIRRDFIFQVLQDLGAPLD